MLLNRKQQFLSLSVFESSNAASITHFLQFQTETGRHTVQGRSIPYGDVDLIIDLNTTSPRFRNRKRCCLPHFTERKAKVHICKTVPSYTEKKESGKIN